MASEIRRSGKNKKKRKKYKLITEIIFICLFLYLLGYLVMFMSKPSVGVEMVVYGSIDVPKVHSGIIVRDEYLVKSDMAGQPVFNYAENSRVKKGALICTVKNTENTASIESKLEKIDRDIINMQKSRSELSLFKDDIERIEKNISGLVDSVSYTFMNQNISQVYSLKNQVSAQINLRNEIWLTENVQSFSEMNEEKTQYESRLAENSKKFITSETGIVSLRYDGLEETLYPGGISKITAEQAAMTPKISYISKSLSVSPGEPLFKLVRSNTWYIVSFIENAAMENWGIGSAVTLYAEAEDEEVGFGAVVESLETGEKATKVVFKTDKNLIDFIGERNLEYTTKSGVYQGIKIPNTAIAEKTLLKIPIGAVITSGDSEGVIKRAGGVDSFTPMDITKKDDKFAYVLQDFENLKLGNIILEGTGPSAAQYQVSETYTARGVFVANSSVAEFKIIDILGQNGDYSIVSANSQYGLKVYDSIVTDAGNISELQSLS